MEEEIIEKNFQEYLEVAEYSFNNKKFNSAVTLYYKALVELCDLELIRKINRIGANHTERFKLLEKNSPELYSISSKMFKFYRDSYNKQISETIAGLVKEKVENAKRIVIDKKMDK
jgi:uncharacterized protein (UPF0332 family)